jgi:NTE family protein
MATKKKISVSLVLGSGGARGLAHIGVIRVLEDNGYEISSISGCSIGALIGGIFAAGKLDELEHWLCAITKVDIMTLLDFSWERSGFVKGDKIIDSLVGLVGDKTIEELPIPFTAVATDVINEKEVWINSGRLFDAIRASISLPLFFTPVKYRKVQLIDGGVLNPVPIAPTFTDVSDLTIAVNLGGPIERREDDVDKDQPSTAQSSTLRQNIDRFIDKFRTPARDGSERDWGPFDIADRAFDAMQSTIARQKLAAYPPDLVIEIARNACGTLEFDRASEMIELGRDTAQECVFRANIEDGHV